MICDRCKWWSAGVRTNKKNEIKKWMLRMSCAVIFCLSYRLKGKNGFPIESYTLSAMLLSTSEWMITIQGVSKFNSIALLSLSYFVHVRHWCGTKAATKIRPTIRKQNIFEQKKTQKKYLHMQTANLWITRKNFRWYKDYLVLAISLFRMEWSVLLVSIL